jgi:hypothetical protein
VTTRCFFFCVSISHCRCFFLPFIHSVFLILLNNSVFHTLLLSLLFFLGGG